MFNCHSVGDYASFYELQISVPLLILQCPRVKDRLLKARNSAGARHNELRLLLCKVFPKHVYFLVRVCEGPGRSKLRKSFQVSRFIVLVCRRRWEAFNFAVLFYLSPRLRRSIILIYACLNGFLEQF